MKEVLKNQLKSLLLASSPSGYEDQAVDLFRSFVSPYVDSVDVDAYGNCIAHKKGCGRKIMIVAHADEIGLMITYIDDKGFLYFKEIGGIDTNLLPGRRVKLITVDDSEITGVIGKKPIHLQERTDAAREFNPEDLWIDIGAKNKDEAEHVVSIGSVATFISDPIELNDNYICSKSLDDRAGLSVLIGVASRMTDSDLDIYYVASVQEELGAIGIQMVASAVMPDIGIVVDVTHASDYPSMFPVKDGNIRLGQGAVIAIGPNMSKEISRGLVASAKENSIPHQIEAIAKPTGTDARMLQIAGTGIKTGLLCIPCRYMHTPNEVISTDDVDSVIDLLCEYLK